MLPDMTSESDEFVLDGERQWRDRVDHREDPDATEYPEFETEPVERPRVEPPPSGHFFAF